jgi:queuosine precursor transporter
VLGARRLDLLIAVYVGCLVMAELMGGKVFEITDKIMLFGNPLGTSVAVFLLPVIFSINNIVNEVYGKERMLSIARSGLFVVFLLVLYTSLFIALPAAPRSPIPPDVYEEVFSVGRRVAIASLIAIFVSMYADIHIYSKIRQKTARIGLWFRDNVTNLFSQFIDTTLFMYLAYFTLGAPNHAFLWSIIIPYWFYKNVVSVAVTPLVYMGVKWLKKEKNEEEIQNKSKNSQAPQS